MANLSDLAAATQSKPPSWIGSLDASRGFVPNPGLHPSRRRSRAGGGSRRHTEKVARSLAYDDGYAAGHAAAEAATAAEAGIAATLGLALAKLDSSAEKALRQRLAETVAQLCEQIIEPHLIDAAALERRCDDALGWFEESAAGLTLRLHPDDIALLPEATCESMVDPPGTGFVARNAPAGRARWRRA